MAHRPALGEQKMPAGSTRVMLRSELHERDSQPTAGIRKPFPRSSSSAVATAPLPGRGGTSVHIAKVLHTQRLHGNRAAQTHLRSVQTAPRGFGASDVQRLAAEDVIPDAVLKPIKSLVSQVTGFSSGVTSKADAAGSDAKSEAETAAASVDTDTGAAVSAEQSKGESSEAAAQRETASATTATEAVKASGGTQAGEIKSAVPVAEHVSDPVKSATQAPPPSKLPGGSPTPPKAGASTWNCDEASILGKISSVGKGVIDGLTRMVKSVVPESVLNFAKQGIATVQRAIGAVKQKVDAARKAVSEWVDKKLKPVREAVDNAIKFASDKINGAKRAIADKVSQLGNWISTKWNSLKTTVSTAVSNAIEWAKKGVGGLVDKAKNLAGRFWDMLPEWIKGPLTGAAAALAAPIVLARKAAEEAAGWLQRNAKAVKVKLEAAADKATKFLGEKYQKVRGLVVKVGERISGGVAWVKTKAAEVGKSVYATVDKLSGGRISKWRAAAAKRFAELKGQVCAITGAAAGPCVERFVPEPVGPGGKSFASLATKADITVPIDGVPVKVAAGATIKIERTSRKYNVVLSGEGFAGVALPKQGGGGGSAKGGGGSSGSMSVEGTLPNKALAMFALGTHTPAAPSIPIPLGPKPAAPAGSAPGPQPAPAPNAATPVAPGPGAATPAAAGPGAAGPQAAGAGGGGGGPEVNAEVGEKVSVALTYTFDATADKTTCDGLGGLTAFLASQGAAALLPPPFSRLASTGGQAAFADKLTSAKITAAHTGSVSLKGGGGSVGAKGESGVSLETRNDEKGKSLTATLFQSLTGEGAVSFTPEKVGLQKIGAALTGRQELAIIYNITLDNTDASFKQSLTGSATLATFAGMTGSLPPIVRQQVQRLLVCLPGANEATVSFELSNNMVNLRALATAIDAELNKGSEASADAVWEAVSAFVKNSENNFIQFSAKLSLTEKVLGVKASGSGDGVSGGAEVSISRGQEIVLCPPVKLEGGAGAAIDTISSAAIPGNVLLCDEDELIKRFGNRRRDLDIDPDEDPTSHPRADDPPIMESFRKAYNRLDSWNTYIRTNHADLYPEFDTTFALEVKRKRWLDELKERAKKYKEEFRDVTNPDPEKARREYEEYVLGNIQKEIEDCNRAIASWYRDKTGSTETIEEIIERIHGGGTELWREAWRAAILQVNKVLSETWPPGKADILHWLGQQRARLPHVDLSGGVGDLDYIGSLATGFKGPPKQQIRFNPDKFDVDANLPAPPLAKYAIAVDNMSPDRKRIFGRTTSISPLKQFSDRTHSELTARVKGYDASDPFDVAIDAPELPHQERSRLASERLYGLRARLSETSYKDLISELTKGGYLDADGKAVRGDLSEGQFKEVNAIMDRYEQGK